MTAFFRFSIILLFVFLLANFCFAQKPVAAADATKKEAERIWELAVEAEGGRQQMNTIQNLVVSSKGQTSSAKIESFYVFPNKSWQLLDFRPSVLGLVMKMYNWETNKKYLLPRGNAPELKSIEQTDADKLKDASGNVAWSGLSVYLLESKWWKPIPKSVMSGKFNGQKVDTVQTDLNGKRVDFSFDQKTHLPVKIDFYNFSKISQTTNIDSVEVSKFSEINKLKMPTTLKESDGNKYNLTYQFNVEYNEDIFTKPPPFEAGAEAWKVKK